MLEFENCLIYKKGVVLHKDIFSLLKENPEIDKHFKDQVKRATTSIIANFAEGFGRYGPADKRRFYVIGRGSAYEVGAILTLIFDLYKISENNQNQLRMQLEEIIKMLTGLIKSTIK